MKKQNPNFTRKHLIYFPILHIIKRYKDVMNVKLEEFFANKKLLRKIIKKILLIITFTVALIFALFNFDRVWGFITGAISLAAPFFIGGKGICVFEQTERKNLEKNPPGSMYIFILSNLCSGHRRYYPVCGSRAGKFR